ncbi:unnamed protein product [Rotaria magnacalcarata]|uniref:Uncharacterized protein n=1 Tax=Rotaria magnacalcarata TaxID=392030 RepID=A0A820IVY9_9BILA|nr:unnamed protein product [Rotaria magnacalcarata]CAF2063220.1 unnamed protein product [Rotaria magnacalcarata]CAF4317744.1 unnamed protein product [Rotaria magnacalcarata]CAF4398808.1 unnamed protein product [Rotaria magnacalcarata]
MVFDSMSESALFEFAQYLNTNPYREHEIKKSSTHKIIPASANPQRLNHKNTSSTATYNQLINNRKNSFTLDRIAYKLRMKSDLNVDTLRDTPLHSRRNYYESLSNKSQNNSNPNIHEAVNVVSSSATTRTYPRQPTAVTRTTNTMKTLVNEEINGIEGSAVHVGTLDDLIKQSHHEEFRIYHRAVEFLDNASSYLQNNRLINERSTLKSTLFSAERIQRKPQALTVYHFNAPNVSRTSSQQSQTNRHRMKEKLNNIDLPLITTQHNNHQTNSLERQRTLMSSRHKRIQESREKILMHTEKQVCNCNKLTIRDPFNSEQQQQTIVSLTKQPSVRYIFPPVRPFGYFTRKSLDSLPCATSLSTKHKLAIKKKRPQISKGSFESLNQGVSDDDDNSQVFNDTIKSLVSFSDADDDSQSPPSTRINFDLKHNKH